MSVICKSSIYVEDTKPHTAERMELLDDLGVLHSFTRIPGTGRFRLGTYAPYRNHVVQRLQAFARDLKDNGFKIFRYTVEEVVYDSVYQDDPLRLL